MSNNMFGQALASFELPESADRFGHETSDPSVESSLAGEEAFRESALELDMTPMIDCVFLLLIFFVLGVIPDLEKLVELPPARYGVAADPRQSVFITVVDQGSRRPARVYLADGKVGLPLPDNPQMQQAAILQAVQAGRHQGKTGIILKAERTVRHAEVARIAQAASQVPYMKLYLAVLESD
ncbi:MAG: biopolymer transporter ExbD [Thermoguttaceae bacterium]|nr:biopolymer transporter ExbD [Thermoguttaceae bacterium]MDW8036730.1 biopolymer transporter ExbD [Thermoguttaceae bacterium]